MRIISIFIIFIVASIEISVPHIRAAHKLLPDQQRLTTAAHEHDHQTILKLLCDGVSKTALVSDDQGKIVSLKQLVMQIFETDFNAMELLDPEFGAVLGCIETLNDYPELLIEYCKLLEGTTLPQEYSSYKPNICAQLGIIGGIDYGHDTILHRALRAGNSTGDTLVYKLLGPSWLKILTNWFKITKVFNIQNDDGNTLLHLLMELPHNRTKQELYALTQFLLQQGISTRLKNLNNKTPLDLAKEHITIDQGQSDIYCLLLQYDGYIPNSTEELLNAAQDINHETLTRFQTYWKFVRQLIFNTQDLGHIL